MNNPDHISESLETICWVKMLKFFDAYPGWKKFGSDIRDKHPGSATLIDTQVQLGFGERSLKVNLKVNASFLQARLEMARAAEEGADDS